MTDLRPAPEAAARPEFDLEQALVEARQDEDSPSEGRIHIAEDVILELTRRALAKVESVLPASSGISSRLSIGRRSPDGIRISVEEGENPRISVDAYVLVRYGYRIPDVAWDVQELLKKDLEDLTGYEVRAVNIHVQGVYFDDAHDEAGRLSAAEAAPFSEEGTDTVGSP